MRAVRRLLVVVSYAALVAGGVALVPGPKKCDESFPQGCGGGDWHPSLALPLLAFAALGFVAALVCVAATRPGPRHNCSAGDVLRSSTFLHHERRAGNRRYWQSQTRGLRVLYYRMRTRQLVRTSDSLPMTPVA